MLAAALQTTGMRFRVTRASVAVAVLTLYLQIYCHPRLPRQLRLPSLEVVVQVRVPWDFDKKKSAVYNGSTMNCINPTWLLG